MHWDHVIIPRLFSTAIKREGGRQNSTRENFNSWFQLAISLWFFKIMNTFPTLVYVSKWLMAKILSQRSMNAQIPNISFWLNVLSYYTQGKIPSGQKTTSWNIWGFIPAHITLQHEMIRGGGVIIENSFPWTPSLDSTFLRDPNLDHHLCIVSHQHRI